MAITVVVGDDNLIVREGIAQLLAVEPGIRVVATCGDLETLTRTIEERRPGVVVADIRMPPTKTDEGIRLAATLRETHPDIGVVVVSNYADPAYALALMDAGSEGRCYLLKERIHDGSQLVSAVIAAAAGGSVIDPKIVEPLVSAGNDERSSLAALTRREREVLAQIAQGKSNAAIAETLVLTKRAVEKHINSIFAKLDLGTTEDVNKRVKAALMFLAEAEARPV